MIRNTITITITIPVAAEYTAERFAIFVGDFIDATVDVCDASQIEAKLETKIAQD